MVGGGGAGCLACLCVCDLEHHSVRLQLAPEREVHEGELLAAGADVLQVGVLECGLWVVVYIVGMLCVHAVQVRMCVCAHMRVCA